MMMPLRNARAKLIKRRSLRGPKIECELGERRRMHVTLAPFARVIELLVGVRMVEKLAKLSHTHTALFFNCREKANSKNLIRLNDKNLCLWLIIYSLGLSRSIALDFLHRGRKQMQINYSSSTSNPMFKSIPMHTNHSRLLLTFLLPLICASSKVKTFAISTRH
jgi:hypothetical protein